jgi:hypothetical protein
VLPNGWLVPRQLVMVLALLGHSSWLFPVFFSPASRSFVAKLKKPFTACVWLACGLSQTVVATRTSTQSKATTHSRSPSYFGLSPAGFLRTRRTARSKNQPLEKDGF